jgi:hypothetical protein
VSDRRGVCGERDHLFALQKPNEARAVVSRQPVVGGMRPVGRGVEAEQVRRRPAQCLRLLAPYREKLACVLDALSPTGDVDQGRRAELKNAEGLPVTGAVGSSTISTLHATPPPGLAETA